MIGGMCGVFASASWGQWVRDKSNDTTPPTAAAQTAGAVTQVIVTAKTGSPVLGKMAGSLAKDVVNEFTKSDGGPDLSQASLPKP